MKRSITTSLATLLVFVCASMMAFSAIPTTQARYLSGSGIGSTGATISWINGNGAKRIVVVYDKTANGNAAADWASVETALNGVSSEYPDRGGDFTAAATTSISTYTSYLVVDVVTGTARSSVLTNLAAGHTYDVHVFEYNTIGGVVYLATDGTTNPRSFTTTSVAVPAAPAITAATGNSEGAKLTWTDGSNATGYYLSIYDNTDPSWLFYNVDIGKPSDRVFWVLGATKSHSFTVTMYSYNSVGVVSPTGATTTFTTTATPAFAANPDWTTADGAILGIGGTSTVTITSSPLQTGLFLTSSTINSVDVSSTFVESAEGVYQFTYEVALDNTTSAAGSLPIAITLKDINDVAGSISTSGTHSPGVDATRPTITNVTSSTADGTYKIDDVINVTVTFSEPITFLFGTGTADLQLETGTTDHSATSATNQTTTTTLNLAYTVVAGDHSSDLDYVATSSFALTGSATIKDAVGNDAVLTLSAPAGAGSLGVNKAIVVDGVRPTVASINTQAAVGNSRTWRVTFSEDIASSSIATGDFTLSNSTNVVAGYVIGTPTPVTGTSVYDVTVTGLAGKSPSVIVGLDFTGEVSDLIGNASSTTRVCDQTYTLADGDAPTAAITAPVADSYQKSITAITGTATDEKASTPNSGVASIQIAVWLDADNDGTFNNSDKYYDGSAWTATAETLLTVTNAASWSYPISISGGNGTYYAYVKTTDNAGNYSTTSATKFFIDNTPPTVAINRNTVTLGASNKTTDDVVSFDIHFSEPIQNFTAEDIVETLTGVTKSGAALAADGGTSTTDFTYTISGLTGDGSAIISIINNGTSPISDIAGNTITAATTAADGAFTIDNTPLAVSTSGIATAATAHADYYVPITYDGGLYSATNTTGAVDVSDFDLTFHANGGTATDATIVSVIKSDQTDASGTIASAGDASVRVFFNVTGTANGLETIVISPKSSSVYDDAGNATPTSVTVTKNLKDVTAPVISNISDNSATFVKSGASVHITFDVTDMGGTPATPTVQVYESTNTTKLGSDAVSDGAPSVASGVYTYSYTYAVPSGDQANVRINVYAVDSTGNVSNDAAAGSYLANAFNIDNTAPTISSVTVSDPIINIADNTSTFEVAVKFSESMKTTGSNPVISFNPTLTSGLLTAGGSSWSTASATNDKFTQGFTIDATKVDYNVNVDVVVTGGSDLAGNILASSPVTVADKFTTDTKSPIAFTTGTVVATDNTVKTGYWNATNTAMSITVPVENEASIEGGKIEIIASNDNFNTSNIDLLASPYYTIIAGDLTTGHVDFTGIDFESKIITVTNGDVWKFKAIITDVNGNPTTGAVSASTITVDQSAPTLTSVTIASNNATTTLAKTGDKITIHITADEDLLTPTVAFFCNTVAGQGTTQTAIVGTDKKTWTSEYTVAALDATGAVTFTIVFSDLSGNAGTQVAAVTSGGSVDIDNTAPAVTAITSRKAMTDASDGVANFFNSNNNKISATFTIPTDASMDGGNVKLQARIGTNAFVNIGDTTNATSSAGVMTLTCDKTGTPTTDIQNYLTNLTDWATGTNLDIRIVLKDKVGNETPGTTFVTPLAVDLVAPTATYTSTTAGDVINITEKGAGFTITGHSSEANGTIYVVKNSLSPTYTTIATDAETTFTANSTAGDPATLATGSPASWIADATTYVLYAMDPAGNLSAASATSFSADLSAPTVVNVTSSTPDVNPSSTNGAYGINKVINVQVVFDQNVTFALHGGYLQLALNTTPARYAICSTAVGTATNTLDFTYTVQEGDVSADLGYVDANSLTAVSGALITDENGNDLTSYTLPIVSAAGSLKTNKDIVIDGVKPTFELQYYSNYALNAPYGPDPKLAVGTAYLKVKPSKSLASEPVITITSEGSNNNLTNETTTDMGGDVYSYTRTINLESGINGAKRERISITATDASGNDVIAALGVADNPTVTDPAVNSYITAGTTTSNLAFIDCSAPTFTVGYYTNAACTTAVANTRLKAGTYYVKVTASELLSSVPKLTFDAEGTANDKATLQTTTLIGGETLKYYYARTISYDAAAEGLVAETLKVTGTDIAGNTSSSVVPNYEANMPKYTDTKPPTVTIARSAVTLGSNFKTTDSDIHFYIHFSEPVQNFTTDINQFFVGVVAAASSTGGSNQDYTYTYSGLTGDGTVNIEVVNNAPSPVTDLAGNTITAATTASDGAFTIDNTPATITNSGTVYAATNGAGYYTDLVFSSGVYTLATTSGALTALDLAATFAANGGSATGVSLVGLKTNDNSDYAASTALAAGATTVRVFFNVTGTANGLETVEIKPADGASIYDDAGNPVDAAQTSGARTLLDKTAPVISSITDDATFVKETATVTIHFNVVELGGVSGNPAVAVTSSDDVAITSAAFSSKTGAGTVVSPYYYTYLYTVPSGDYTDVKVKVDAADVAGNNATQGVELTAFTIDNTNPVVAIDASVPTNGSYQKSISAISGTSSDASAGVASVQVAIWKDNNSNGAFDASTDKYLNVTKDAFDQDNPVWLSASGTTTWSYTDATALAKINGTDGIYFVQAKATDNAANSVNTAVTSRKFYIDNSSATQIAPTIAVTSGTLVNGYYNSTNSGITITVPIDNDASLVGGTFVVQYQTDADGDFNTGATAWSDAIASTSISAVNTTVDKTMADGTFAGLVAEGSYIRFRAYTTDQAGNHTDGVPSSSLKRDETAPTISSATDVSATDYIDVTFSEAVYTGISSNVATGQLATSDLAPTFTKGTGTATACAISGLTNNSGGALVGGESIVRVALSVTGTPNGLETIEISPASLAIYDIAGNAMDAAQTTTAKYLRDLTAPAVTNIAVAGDYYKKSGATATITFDVAEAKAITDVETATTNPLVQIYQNDGTTLIGVASWGAAKSGNTYTYTYSIPSVTSYYDVKVKVTATDVAGNVTPVISGALFSIDNTAPSQSAVTYAANNGTVVANTFNSTNVDGGATAVTLSIPIANDATLVGGTYKIQKQTADNTGFTVGVVTWSDIAALLPSTILTGDKGTTKTQTLTKDQFELLVGEGKYIQFRAVTVDLAGNSADGAASSSILRDETLPTLTTVSIASNNANTSLATTGNTITLHIEASEPIATPTVTMLINGAAIHGTAPVFTNAGGNTWNAPYIVVVGDENGAASFTVNFTDVDGNVGGAVSATTAPTSSVTVDKGAATATVTITPNNAVAPTNDFKINNATTSIAVKVVFNKTMDNSVTPAITITGANTGATSGAAWTATTHTNDTYTINYAVSNSSPISGTFTVAVADAQDLTGNSMTAYSDATLKIDQVVPTVTLATGAPVYNIAFVPSHPTTTFTATFSEEMIPETPSIDFNGTDLSGVFKSPTYAWSGSDKIYTVTKTITNDGLTSAYAQKTRLNASSARDLAGNYVAQTISAGTFIVDMVAPIATTVSMASGNTPYPGYAKSGQDVIVTLVASEDLAQINSPKIATLNATPAGSGVNWTITKAMAGTEPESALSFSFTMQDEAGNTTAVSALTGSNTAVIADFSAPTISTRTISTSGNTVDGTKYANASNTITVTLTADNSELITNPTTATIGGLTAAIAETTATNVKTLTTNASSYSNGVISAIDINGYSDRAGNAGAEYTTVTGTVTVDKTAPTISATSASVGTSSIALNRYYLDLTFDGPIYSNSDGTGALSPSDFDAPTIVQGNGFVASAIITAVRNTSSTDPANAGGTLAAGATSARVFFVTYNSTPAVYSPAGCETIKLALKAGEVFDAAGNVAVNQSSAVRTLPDKAAPVITEIATNAASYKSGATATITFKVEEFSGLGDVPTVNVKNSLNVSSSATYSSVSGTGIPSDKYVFTYTYAVGAGNDVMSIDISAVDNNNLTGTASLASAFIIDNTVPVATISAPVANNYQKSITTISGTASDVAATTNSGLANVKVAVWLDGDNNGAFDGGTNDHYWTGSAWTGTTATFNAVTSGSTTWSYTLGLSATTGTYYVQTQTTDNAGNVTTSIVDAYKFYIDNTAQTPAIPVIASTGNNVVTGYFNNTNTGIRIPVIIALDSSLNGGSFKLQYATSADAYASWNDVTTTLTSYTNHTITSAEAKLGATVNYDISSSDDVKALVAEGNSIEFRTVIADIAGNSATGSASNAIKRDVTAPTITSNVNLIAVATATNEYFIDVPFSEGVYTNIAGTSAVVASDFNSLLGFLANTNGTATAIANITPAGDGATTPTVALAGGESNIRIFFDVTTTASGLETIEVKPADGTSIYDIAGNALASTETSGSKFLKDETAPAISAISVGNATYVNQDSTVTITFNLVEAKGITTNPLVEIIDGSTIGTSSWTSRTGAGTTSSPFLYTYTYTGTTNLAGNHTGVTVKVSATDNASLSSNLSLNNAFTIDNTLPTISSLIVSDAIISKADDGATFNVVVKFSETMKTSVAPTITFDPALSSGLFIAGTGVWSNDGTTNNTFTQPYTVHTNFEDYNVNVDVITAGAKDLAGNLLASSPVTTADKFTTDTKSPIDFTTGTVVATDNTVKAGYWNSTNSHLSVTVPIENEPSLAGGTIRLFASKDNFGNSYDLVASYTITGSDVFANNHTFDLTNFESFTTIVDADVWKFNAILTDINGNPTTGTASSSTITVDQTLPTLTSVAIASNNVSSDATIARTGDKVTISISALESIGTPTVAFFCNGTAGAGTINTTGSGTSWTSEYTVASGDASGAVTFTINFVDIAGNAGSTVSNATGSVTIDNTYPVASTMGTVTTAGAPVVSGYWNNQNSSLTVATNLSTSDASLDGGTLKIQMLNTAGTTWKDVLSASSLILNSERVAGTKSITIPKADLIVNDQYVDGATVQFRAKATDKVGNPTDWPASSNLVIDVTAPATPVVTVNGGNKINLTNETSVPVVITGEANAAYSYLISDGNPAHNIVGSGSLNSSGALASAINLNLSTMTDGTITGTTTLTDAAGNVSAVGSGTATKASTPAQVTNVVATNADGSYPIGSTITVNVTFSKKVTFAPGSGSLSLTLNPSPTTRYATSTTAVGTAAYTLPLTYNVQLSDVSSDLDYTATTSLALLNSATITDEDGNPITDLTLPTVGGANSIGGQKAIVIDGVYPTFTVGYYTNAACTTAITNTRLKAGIYYIKVSASEVLGSAPTISIDAEGSANDISNIATTSLSANTYVYARTIASDVLAVGTTAETITITGTDFAGNTSTAVAPTSHENTAIYTDTKFPTFTVGYYTNIGCTSAITNARLKAGTYYVKVSASEALSSAPTVAIAAEGTANNVASGATILLSGNDYYYTRTIAYDDAAVGTTAEAITITGTDIAGNTSTAVAPASHENTAIYTDTKNPVITPVTIASDYATNPTFAKSGALVTISLTSDEILSGVSVVNIMSGASLINATPTIGGSGKAWTVSYAVNSSDIDGAVSFSLTTTDLAGNTSAVTSATSGTVTVDKVNPNASTAGLTMASSYTNTAFAKTGHTVTLTLVTDEPVSIASATIAGLAATTITPSTGYASSFTISKVMAGTEAEGSIAFSIPVTDRAGNTNTYSAVNSGSAVVYDKTIPVIASNVITSPLSTTTWKSGSNDITWTSANITDALYSGLATNPITIEYSTNSGTDWTVLATNEANDGTYTWSVPSSNLTTAKIRITAIDNAGNTNSQESGLFAIDNINPTVVLSNDISPRTEVKGGQHVIITATFTDASSIDETTVPKITLSNTTVSAATMTKSTNKVWTYDWTVPMDNALTCVASITAKDVAGNSNDLATGVTTFTVDNIAPTVAITNGLSGERTCVRDADGNITLTATFTETNTITTAPTITITNGNANGTGNISAVAMTKTDNNHWTYSWDVPNKNDNALACNVTVSASDVAGNIATTATGSISYTVDNVKPTVVLATTAANIINGVYTVTATFDETVYDFTVGDITKTGAGTAAITDFVVAGTNTWSFLVTPSADGTIVLNVNAAVATDCSSNTNNASNTLTITYDKTNPALAFTSPNADIRTNGSQLLSYTESDTHLGTTRARITNGTFAPFTSGTAISTLSDFANASNGVSFTVELENTDLAGNQTIISRNYVKDVTAPTVSSVVLNNTIINRNNIGPDNLSLTITYNEDMDRTSVPTIVFSSPVPTDALSDGTGSTWISKTEYVKYYNILDKSAIYNDIDIAVSGAKDTAQNTQTTTSLVDQFSMTLIGPSLSTVAIAATNTNTAYAKVGTPVILSFTSSVALKDVSANIAGHIASISGSGTTWTASTNMLAGDNEGVILFTIDYKDLSGNPGITVPNTTNSSTVTFDKTLPIVNITAPLANAKVNGGTITYTVTESHQGSSTGSSDGTTFTSFTSASSAINTLGGWISVNEGTFIATIKHTDLAGNEGTATISLVKDITPPTISALALTCDNLTTTVTFSEPVYTNSGMSGALTAGDFSAVRTGSGATVYSHSLISNTAGTTTAVLGLVWNGMTTGFEVLNIDAASSNSIYDAAGNAMVMGTPKTLNVKILPTVSSASVSPSSVCGSGQVTFSATASVGAIKWYSALTGGTEITVLNPTISTTTTYYAEAQNNGCVSATRTAVTATANTIPTVSTASVTPTSVCGSGQVTFSATASSGSIKWYSALTGGTEITVLNPTISTTTTYYAEAQNNGCVSATRTAVTATVNTTPTVSTASVSPTSVCGSGQVTFSATASVGAIKWYSALTGGTEITNLSPTISTNTTYYAEAQNNGCVSATRTAVMATVNAIPTVATASVSPTSVCGSGQITFSATASAGLIKWYSALTGGTEITVLNPTISTTTTYYAEAQNNGCVSATRTAVTATVNAIPTVLTASVSPTSVCGSGVATFSATASVGSIKWYSALTGGTEITNLSPSISTNTTYYAEAQNNGCVSSARTAVTATVNTIPTVSTASVSPTSVCGSGQVTFSATASVGAIKWYSTLTGGTEITVLNPTISTTTTYYAEAQNNGCVSATRTAVTATVNTIPTVATASVTPTSVCGSGQVTFSATASSGSIKWYSALTGGTEITVLNPTISSTTTYYVEAQSNGCVSATRTAVTATVNTTPTVSTASVSPTSVCGSGQVTFSATASVGAIKWYNAPTGGTEITNLSPTISTNTTYYAEAQNNGCVSTTRTAVTATVNTVPTVATASVTPTSVCGSGTVTFSATASAGAIKWYNASTGGTEITNLSPSISTNTTYYAEAQNNGCVSSTRTAVTATVNAIPTVLTASVSPTSVCGSGVVTFSATASVGSIKWYSASTGGTEITNLSPSISTNTTYYAEAQNNGCVSATRTAVTATVNTIPTVATASVSPTSVCGSGQVTFSATASVGAIKWYSALTGGTEITALNPTISTTTTYYAEAQNNGCVSATRTAVKATVNPYPSAAGTVSGTSTVNAGDNNVAYSVPAITNANSYAWSYSGAGAVITGGTTRSITINFSVSATSGTLTVYGVNTCGNGTSATYPITVNAAEAPSFTLNPSSASKCETVGATFTGTATGNPNPTVKWQVSTDGTNYTDISSGSVYSGYTSSTLTISSVAGLNGYKYRLAATNIVTTTYSTAATLTVVALPAAPIASGSEICAGSSATITPTAVSGITFAYYTVPTGGISLGSGPINIVVSPSATTTYYVEAINSTSCVSSSRTPVVITVITAPDPAIVSDATICSGSGTTITPTAVTGVNFNYYSASTGGTALLSGSASYSVAPATTTVYYVEAYKVATGCTATTRTPVTITVNTAPSAPASITPPAGKLVSGNSYTFTTAVSSGATGYSWTFPSGWTKTDSTLTTMVVTPNAGVGNVTVSARNDCGSSPAFSTSVVVLATEPLVNSTLTMTARSKTSITLRIVGHAGAGRFVRGLYGIALPTSSSTPAFVELEDGNPPTNVSSTLGGYTSSDGLSLLYSGSDTLVTISGLASNKSYTFCVNEFNGSGVTTNYTTASTGYTFKTTLKDGDEEINENTTTGFSVSAITPNPATTNVNFTVNASEAAEYKIELYNETGQVAYSNYYKLNGGDNQVSFSLTSATGMMPAGVYYLRVSANGEMIVKQVVVNP